MRTLRLAVVLAVAALATPQDAHAWVAVRGGWGWHGGFVAPVAGAMVAGAVVGAAVASAAAPVYTYPAPVYGYPYTYPTTTYVAPPPVNTVLTDKLSINTTMWTLPAGCNHMAVNDQTYYQCGVNWLKPYMGANGTYYGVVAAP